MNERIVTVSQDFILRNRQITYFVQKANEFKSSLWIEVGERRAHAKSLLGVVAIGMDPGTVAKLIAEGEDAEQALEELAAILE